MKRILVLDDEERIRNIYKKLLTLEGYEVIEAATAMHAHEILKREPVDLILLDIKMPKVDGSIMYDVIEQFHSRLKVIVSSVYPLEVQKRVVPRACDYYDKSEGNEVLLSKIRNCLGDLPSIK
ncbi:response regulator [bacterium]|nr:response regulator [bacterium]